MKDQLFVFSQYLLPQRALSRLVGWLAESKISLIKNTLTQWFVKRYKVDMTEAEEPNPLAYQCFNDFFTRALKPKARPIHSDSNSIVFPADGVISQLGTIEKDRIFQAKGRNYSLLELMGGEEKLAQPFNGGLFATVYLSPKDYHRVHIPLAGKLKTMVHVPGDLFSVNDVTAQKVPRLFARNERVVAVFETEIGSMAVVLVGAMIVASIETTWAGLVTPQKRRIRTNHYPDPREFSFSKGDEIGRFKLGSTAIVLLPPKTAQWDEQLQAGSSTQVGALMGRIL